MTQQLSPAAQAVLDAFLKAPMGQSHVEDDLIAIAAALRAASASEDLEIPFAIVNEWERIESTCASFYAAADWGYKQALAHLLAIADELEAQ